MAAVARMLKHKWVARPKVVDESYEGRTIIVTGANTGLGFEAAAQFVEKGAAKVILGVRDSEKGDRAKAVIESRTHQTCHIDVWKLDMSSYDSIRVFAERASALDRLDIALLNAGVFRSSYHQSEYGWEEDLQVNTLSTTLLAILLLPKLKASKTPDRKTPILEVINSGLHRMVQLDPKILDSASILQKYNTGSEYAGNAQYSLSKLFLIYATNKLAEMVSSKDVLVMSVCPGMVQTDLGRDYQFFGAGLARWAMGKLIQRPVDEGARVYISATTAGEEVHGRFYQYDEIQPVSPTIEGERNKAIAERVWKEVVEILSKDVPDFKMSLEQITKV